MNKHEMNVLQISASQAAELVSVSSPIDGNFFSDSATFSEALDINS